MRVVGVLLLLLVAVALLSAYAVWTWSVTRVPDVNGQPGTLLSIVRAAKRGNTLFLWVYNGGRQDVNSAHVIVLAHDGATEVLRPRWSCDVIARGETCVAEANAEINPSRITLIVGAWQTSETVVEEPLPLPNIVIDIRAPTTALAGDDYIYEVNACNLGDVATGTFTVRVERRDTAQGTTTASEYNTELAPRACDARTLSDSAPSPTTIEYTAIADYYDVVAETNEADNVDNATVNVGPSPESP